MKLFVFLLLIPSIFGLDDSFVVTLCQNNSWSGWAINTRPVLIQTSNFGIGPYTAATNCSLKFEIIPESSWNIVVDYVALASNDYITISDGTNNLNEKLVNQKATDFTRTYQTSNAFTISLTSLSTTTTAGFRAFAWLTSFSSLGSVNLTTDTVLTSDANENATFNVQNRGDLYLYLSTTSNFNVAMNNNSIPSVSNQVTNLPHLLSDSSVGTQFSASQTSNRFIFIFRVQSGQTNSTNVTTSLTDANPSVNLSFPETGGIYANNMAYTQTITFAGIQTISFEFSVFETEDNSDLLVITTPQGNKTKITGPLIDGNGQDYPGSDSGWIKSFAFYNVTSPVQMTFTSNGAIGGVGYKVRVTQGVYVPPSTVTTTPTVPSTTPFVGTTSAVNFTSADNPANFSSEGYPNTLPKNWNKIWQFNPVNTSFWSFFILLDSGKTFSQDTGAQLTVYTGKSTSPQPWDIQRSYNFGSYSTEPHQALAPAPGQSLSVEFNSGNTSFTDSDNTYGIRFLIAMLDVNSINRTSNSTSLIDRNVNTFPISDTTYGYPNYLYPNTTQIYRYFPTNNMIELIFYIFDYGSTFDYNNAKLIVYTGNATNEPNQTDILYEYKTRADATNNAVLINPVGKPLSVRFTTTQGESNPGQNLGVLWHILPGPQNAGTNPSATTSQTVTVSTTSFATSKTLSFLALLFALIFC